MGKIDNNRVLKPTTTYNQLRESFKPEAKMKTSTIVNQIKEGNRKINETTLRQLKEKEDPFTRKPTRPKMICSTKKAEKPVDDIPLPMEGTLEDQIAKKLINIDNKRKSIMMQQQKQKIAVQQKPMESSQQKRMKSSQRKPIKSVEQNKLITSRYDPLKNCFNPEARSKLKNNSDRVKEGNKTIDAEIIRKLREESNSESVPKATSVKESSRKIEVEDPFTRRPTRPKMISGSKTEI